MSSPVKKIKKVAKKAAPAILGGAILGPGLGPAVGLVADKVARKRKGKVDTKVSKADAPPSRGDAGVQKGAKDQIRSIRRKGRADKQSTIATSARGIVKDSLFSNAKKLLKR